MPWARKLSRMALFSFVVAGTRSRRGPDKTQMVKSRVLSAVNREMDLGRRVIHYPVVGPTEVGEQPGHLAHVGIAAHSHLQGNALIPRP